MQGGAGHSRGRGEARLSPQPSQPNPHTQPARSVARPKLDGLVRVRKGRAGVLNRFKQCEEGLLDWAGGDGEDLDRLGNPAEGPNYLNREGLEVIVCTV